jgi:competence protein ComEA
MGEQSEIGSKIMFKEKRSGWVLQPGQKVFLAVLLLVLLFSLWIRNRFALLPWRDMEDASPVPSNSFVLEVEGDLVSPGIYTFPEPVETEEVLAKARVPATLIPKNVPPTSFESGTTIIVSQTGQGLRIDAKPMAPAKRILYGIPIDLNEIRTEELGLLPGIGPTLAQRIVRYREDKGRFTRLEELRNVSGIGGKKFESLRRYLSVQSQKPNP